jgi:MinD-like ATPase involved in chromosome partitioning or flagellar assembly
VNKIVCCVKSKESYNRIINQFKQKNVEWEDYILELDDVKAKMVFTEYDLAIIDVRLWWKDEAIEFFEKKDIQVIIFQGDFEEVLTQLQNIIPDVPEPVEEKVPESSTIFEDKPKNETIYIDRPVYKPVYGGFSNRLVFIANLSSRAGSSFLTLNLSRMLAKLDILTSVIEPPINKPYYFDTVGIDERLKRESNGKEEPEFYSYPHIISAGKKLFKDRETIIDGIIWLVSDSRKPLICDKKDVSNALDSIKEALSNNEQDKIIKAADDLMQAHNRWDYFKMMKLIYASKKAVVNIVDCGGNLEHESIKNTLSEPDLILIVVDPLPTECMQNERLLEELISMKKSGYPIEFVVNRWASGINREQLLDFLRITPLATVPYIDSRYIYDAIYNYRLPIDNSEVETAFNKPFSTIIKRIVPTELIKGPTQQEAEEVKGKGIFSKIKGILRRTDD